MNKDNNVKNLIFFFENNDKTAADSLIMNKKKCKNNTVICPLCNHEYGDQTLLGEHFVNDHNSYDDLCKLDVKNVNLGWPGIEVLDYIEMIKTQNNTNDCICMICEECCDIKMTCCKKSVCSSCLRNFMENTNILVCPHCKKDHSYTQDSFIKYFEISDDFDKEKWINWWCRHQEIFY